MSGASRTPTFLIVGAAKAGTTSLAAYLESHPDVFMAREKEVHFFDREERYRQGWEWYCDRFATAGDASAVGEATPTYMWQPAAVERMARHLPQVQLIALLRNPIERAYSHYWHVRGFDAESRSFEESIADPDMERRVGYMSRGRYAEQLRRLGNYYAAEQIHVLLFEDLVQDAHTTLAETCNWLGVQASRLPLHDVNHNPRFRLRSRRLLDAMVAVRAWRRFPRLADVLMQLNRAPVQSPPMAPETRARLVELFAPDNAELELLIGRDLSAWNR